MTRAFQLGSGDPVKEVAASKRFLIGQLGLSLDGRIATHTGHSQYINHKTGLVHLHRLRAICDAVIVGVSTVNADDPRLTVRLCEGQSPVRVIIDPNGRVFQQAQMFKDPGPPVLVFTAEDTTHPLEGQVEVIPITRQDGRMKAHDIVEKLNQRGLEKLFVEGGSKTLSSFLNAGLMDHLHLIMAPMLLGSGYNGLNLSAVCKVDEALTPQITLHDLGHDIVFDCLFSRNR